MHGQRTATVATNNASKKINAYKNARNNQCKDQYQQLKQSINGKSLKAIDKLTRKRWNNREVGPGFASESITNIGAALASGVELNATSNAPVNHSTLKNSEVVK